MEGQVLKTLFHDAGNRVMLEQISFMRIIRHAVRHRTLVEATWRGDIALVRGMVSAGSPVNAPGGWFGRLLCPVTALAVSCMIGSMEIAEVLLAAGADVTDHRAGSPIEAVIVGRSLDKPEFLRLLIKHGARPSDGVRSAAFRGEVELLSQLNDAGTDLRLALAPPVSIYRIPSKTLMHLRELGISLPPEALERLAAENGLS